MTTLLQRRAAALGAASVLALTPLLVPAQVEAAGGLSCRASMSDATPKQYSYIDVRVSTAPSAKVRTVAHYRTTDTVKHRRANRSGKASLEYYISSATAGYRVWVDVRVSKGGRSASCRTSFVPHA